MFECVCACVCVPLNSQEHAEALALLRAELDTDRRTSSDTVAHTDDTETTTSRTLVPPSANNPASVTNTRSQWRLRRQALDDTRTLNWQVSVRHYGILPPSLCIDANGMRTATARLLTATTAM